MAFVLGVDLGKVNLGLAVYESDSKKVITTKHINVHNYYTSFCEIEKFAADNQCSLCFLEKPNFPAMAMKHGYYVITVQGIVKAAMDKLGIPLGELSPSEVKKGFTGSGKATKEDIIAVVHSRYDYFVPNKKQQKAQGQSTREVDHEYDAIAIAIVGYDTLKV